MEERQVRDRFVVGQLSDMLCRNTKLTLKDAWTQVCQSEDADKERRLSKLDSEPSYELYLDVAKIGESASRRRSDVMSRVSQSKAERLRTRALEHWSAYAPGMPE